jgi:hypothetical protein
MMKAGYIQHRDATCTEKSKRKKKVDQTESKGILSSSGHQVALAHALADMRK